MSKRSTEVNTDEENQLPLQFGNAADEPIANHTATPAKEKPPKKVIPKIPKQAPEHKIPQYKAKEKLTPAKLLKLAKIRKEQEAGKLQFWPDGKLAAPGVVLRSPLFGVRDKRKKRLSYERVEIASYGGAKIVYTGTQLDQDDLDVLLVLFDLQKRVKVGDPIEVQEAHFLKILGYTDDGLGNFKTVRNSIARLKATCVEIHVGDVEYYGSLLASCERNRKTGILQFQLDPRIISIFNVSVRQDRTVRSLLHSDLTKWLYGYLCSHTASPHVVRIDTLMPLSGSRVATEVDFRKKLKDSLDELKANDAVIEYHIDKKKDKVGKAYWLLSVWKKLIPEITAQVSEAQQ